MGFQQLQFTWPVASLVIRLVDVYTSRPPVDPRLRVSLCEDPLKKPVYKPQNGMCVFTDLTEGATYTVQIQSEQYVDVKWQVTIHMAEAQAPTVYVYADESGISESAGASSNIYVARLIPAPAYPFSGNATLVRGMLKQQTGKPLADAVVRAYVDSTAFSKAALAKKMAAGDQTLTLRNVLGRVEAGDCFRLQGESADQVEFCIISQVMDDTAPTYQLKAPLQFSYSPGTPLLPVYQTKSNAQGDVVIAWNLCKAQSFAMKVEWTDGESEQMREVMAVQEGRTAYFSGAFSEGGNDSEAKGGTG